jgi:hypothetical protein
MQAATFVCEMFKVYYLACTQYHYSIISLYTQTTHRHPPPIRIAACLRLGCATLYSTTFAITFSWGSSNSPFQLKEAHLFLLNGLPLWSDRQNERNLDKQCRKTSDIWV